MRLTTLYILAISLVFNSSFGKARPESTTTSSAAQTSFIYNATHFLLNGAPYQIIGGQMDPQRIPPAYWRARLRLARAMGLNTIFTYTFWNLLEPVPSAWENKNENDIAAFFRIAQEEDLNVVLRPGPYICGEREWGGFPAWLSTVPDMVVRSNNAPFLDASEKYLSRLARDLRGLHVHESGPILMVQVENEYGSYGADHAYTSAIKDLLKSTFGDVVLYTNDGTEQWTLEGGSVPGVLAEVDGDPRAGFAALRKYITDPSMKGPLLDGEYYTHTFDSWGFSRSEPPIQAFLNDVDYVLGNESAGISLYMVHGGTNFGWSNGALWQNKTRAFTTSYDYGAPIDEAGRMTPLYHALRSTISKYVPKGSIPDVPDYVPLGEIPAFELKPIVRLFDTAALGKKVESMKPRSMEALGQSYGFTLYTYTHASPTPLSGILHPGDRPRDRVIVYVNDSFIGVIDSTYQFPSNVTVTLEEGAKLGLLVENLGRVDYYSRGTDLPNHVLDPFKGIVGDVTVGKTTLEDWMQHTIPLDSLPDLPTQNSASDDEDSSSNGRNTTQPLFLTGAFTLPPSNSSSPHPAALDTYLEIQGGVKGNVWVNGFHLGRYWRRGPQQSLYVPGTILHPNGTNEVVVLELEPGRVEGGLRGVGVRERVWAVERDEDCVGCV